MKKILFLLVASTICSTLISAQVSQDSMNTNELNKVFAIQWKEKSQHQKTTGFVLLSISALCFTASAVVFNQRDYQYYDNGYVTVPMKNSSGGEAVIPLVLLGTGVGIASAISFKGAKKSKLKADSLSKSTHSNESEKNNIAQSTLTSKWRNQESIIARFAIGANRNQGKRRLEIMLKSAIIPNSYYAKASEMKSIAIQLPLGK